jgi:hypothetical protein
MSFFPAFFRLIFFTASTVRLLDEVAPATTSAIVAMQTGHMFSFSFNNTTNERAL